MELMVVWINRVQNHRIVERCTWRNKTMDCKEMIVEKENSGWLGSHAVSYTNPNFLFLKSGHIFFRKPDNSPARKYQLFLVDREAKIKQLTKGVEEVTDVINFNSRSTIH